MLLDYDRQEEIFVHEVLLYLPVSGQKNCTVSGTPSLSSCEQSPHVKLKFKSTSGIFIYTYNHGS